MTNQGAEGVSLELDGLVLSGDQVHLQYLEDVREGRREAFMADLLQDSVRDGGVVVDVGAFVGHFTLLAARSAGVSGTVFAFEPNPRDFPWLRRNVAMNGFDDRVVAIPKALADHSAVVRLYLAGRDPTQSSLFPPSEGASYVEIEALTLDDYWTDRAPSGLDLVKIDVEGAELRALVGMRRALASGATRPVLFVECNPAALERGSGSSTELLETLHGLGYRVQLIDEDRRRLRPFDGSMEGKTYVNLYCTPG
jgi:FkbM family methyltransferase